MLYFMVEDVDRVYRELTAKGLPELSVGIGIEHGTVVAGLVGTRDLMEFTVVGRTVNLAARVQAITRDHGVEILVTERVRAVVDGQYTLCALPPATLKGIAEPVPIWSVS